MIDLREEPVVGRAGVQQPGDDLLDARAAGALRTAIRAGRRGALGVHEGLGPVELLEVGDELVQPGWCGRVVAHPASEREPMTEPARECKHLERALVPELGDLDG